MNEIKSYLRVMCKKIKSKKQRHSAYREISNHLHSQVEHLEEQGLSKEVACTQILKTAVSPAKLGKKLNNAHSPWYIRHVVLVATGSVSALGCLAFVASLVYATQNELLPALFKSSEIPTEIASLVEKDLEFLSQNPIGLETTRLRNAHSFLTTKTSNKSRVFDMDNLNAGTFIMKYRNWKSDKTKVEALISDPKLFEFQAQWVEEILNFDHWNHFNKSEFQRHKNSTSLTKIQTVSSYSIPDNGTFTDWVLIYAFQQAALKRPLKGLRLMRHAAKLMNSQRTLVGQSFATHLLNYERKFAMHINADWKYFSKSHVERYRRASWAWAQIINFSSYSGASLKRWAVYAKPSLGFCAGVLESPLGLTAIESFFSKAFPFESSIKSVLSKNKAFQKSMLQKCGLHELTPLLATSKASFHDKENAFDAGFIAPSWLAKILPNPLKTPYLRQYYALKMMMSSKVNFTGIYERLIEEQQAREAKS